MEQDYDALFAAHHRRLINTLGALSSRVGDDVVNTPELLTYLWEHRVPHAQAEEATLYQCGASLPDGDTLVSSMVEEHRAIVERIRALSVMFETKADAELQDVLRSLVELIYAHFQKEEEALNPLAAHWVRGKRAVVEPSRLLTAGELMERVKAHFGCPYHEPLVIPQKVS